MFINNNFDQKKILNIHKMNMKIKKLINNNNFNNTIII